MKNIKQLCLRVFFGIEIVLFAYMYLFGPHGMRALMNIEQDTVQLNSEVTDLQTQVHSLEFTIAQWDVHPFYKEKIAREQLQMAGKNEEIYYV